MKWRNLLLGVLASFIILSLYSCSKNEDKETNEINYGNFTGKMVFRQYSTYKNDKIIVVDFNKRTSTFLAPRDNAIIWDGSVSIAPGGDKISYSAYDDGYGGYQVFSMSSSGGDYVKLTSADNFVRHFNWPTWNPDGSKIFYVAAGLILGGPVYSVSPNGDNNMLIADLDVHTRVCVSGNENYLLLGLKGAPDYPSGGIFTYDLQNKKLNQIVFTDNTSYAYGPVYSPDEQKIAYVVRHGINDQGHEPYYYKIIVMNADGSEGKTVIEIPWSNHFEYSYVTWSPDGTKLAFNGTIINSAEAEHIYIINLDGTGLTQITSGNWWYVGPYWVK
jgi:Tol biopolymer transport system component